MKINNNTEIFVFDSTFLRVSIVWVIDAETENESNL